MSSVVLKWPLVAAISVPFELSLPPGARVVDLQFQDGMPTVWTVSETSEPDDDVRQFVVVPTGAAFDGEYVATLHDRDAGLVWHLVEVVQR